MTGSELYDFTTQLLDDEEIGTEVFYNLLNVAKDNLEEERPWQFLKKLDSSNTASVGNNYSTPITLPTDFRRELLISVGDTNEYTPVEFEQQHIYRYSSNYYTLDIANSYLYLLGNVGKADPIYIYYLRTTPELTSSNSPVFPSRFHKLLSFYVTGLYQNGIDADDIFARMSTENKLQYQLMKNAMINWDMNLQVRSRNNQLHYAGETPTIDLALM